MKKIFFAIVLAMICGSISAQTNYQNQYSQFGNSYTTDENGNRIDRNGNRVDRDGNPIDTTAVIDAYTIPIGIQSWTRVSGTLRKYL